jgi:di/tricarboxylate transporter
MLSLYCTIADMTWSIALIFALLIFALIVFALDLFPIGFVAFAIMGLILLLAPFLQITPDQAVSGFSNEATITVLAMFVLAGGIFQTGVINIMVQRIQRLAKGSEVRQIALIGAITGPLSAFVNNTPIVAIMIPVVVRIAREAGRAPSKLLIPLSYTAQLAGVVTLIGTSTNVLASSRAVQLGLKPFGMFDFAHIGLIVFVVGFVYVLLIGRHLLPERRAEGIKETYHVKEYMAEVIIPEDSSLVNVSISESRLSDDYDLQIIQIRRKGERLILLNRDQILKAEDTLLVLSNHEQLMNLKEQKGIELASGTGSILEDEDDVEIGFLEVIVGPNSDMIGTTLASVGFRTRFGCNVIAMRKHGKLVRDRIARVKFEFGDALLLEGTQDSLERIKLDQNFIVTEELETERFNTDKAKLAVGIAAGVVTIAALGWLPIMVAAVTGAILMVLAGCLNVAQLYQSIRWDVVFLLAGLIPLGIALEATGGAELIAGWTESLASGMPPIFALILFYVVSMLFTAVASNNAAVVVLIPIGVSVAHGLGIDPHAVILAIMFAASNDFATPVGYQTNTMVYEPGGYKFLDYTKAGGPLNLILTVVTPLLIYFLWGV